MAISNIKNNTLRRVLLLGGLFVLYPLLILFAFPFYGVWIGINSFLGDIKEFHYLWKKHTPLYYKRPKIIV